MPNAARVGDMHICPQQQNGIPHTGGPIYWGSNHSVFIGGVPAATVGNLCLCSGPPDSIIKGSATVFIGGFPAARLGDTTAHGGTIISGCPTVNIG